MGFTSENLITNTALFQTEMSDDIELEETELVDRSFLDVSLAEEVNSNSQENYCCGVCNKVFRRKAVQYYLTFLFEKGKR
jgi:hypothetical protein